MSPSNLNEYVPTADVYIGTWFNHDNGVLTLTLRDREAAILSAALVIFVGIVASNAWGVAKFLLHQLRAGRNAGDELHKQQQVALRNSANHVHALTLLTQLAFRRGRPQARPGGFWITILLMLIALIALVAWSAAQLFITAAWTVSGGQSLIASNHCGLLPTLNNITRHSTQIFFTYVKNRVAEANTYQFQCYNGHSDGEKCRDFPVPQIAWTAQDAGCPYADQSLCVSTNSTPFRMDTGYLNSRTHLGVNGRTEDTLDYRYVAVCSPIVTDFNRTRSGVTRYFYGANEDYEEEDDDRDITFAYNRTEMAGVRQYGVWGYRSDFSKEFRNSTPAWQPNDTMIPDKEAVTMSIFFITSNDMTNINQVYDPIFATKPSGREVSDVPAYVPVNRVSILGCTEEYELCNPTLPAGDRCVPLHRKMDNQTLFNRLQLNPTQSATALILRHELVKNSLHYYVNIMSPQLLASTTLRRGSTTYFQYFPFPIDQWRKEVSRWFDMNLIMLQSAFVDFATGPLDGDARVYIEEPGDLVEHHPDVRQGLWDICKTQIVRNVVGVRSFNLRTILAVVITGTAIAILGCWLPDMTGWVQKMLNRDGVRRQQWIQDDMLQPAPPAYQGLPRGEYGGWQGDSGSAEQMKYPLASPSSAPSGAPSPYGGPHYGQT